MKIRLGAIGWLMLCGCPATVHGISRGEWALVWADPGSKEQEVIAREKYDAEVAEGNRRGVTFLVNEKVPTLADQSSPLQLTLGTVGRFRLNEGNAVAVGADEAVFDAYWTSAANVDGWKGDTAVVTHESTLYLRPTRVGKGTLKLRDDVWGSHDFEVVVSPAAAKQK